MSVPRLYAPGLEPVGGTVELPSGEAHHVTRVLRLRAGDEVRVFDGRGREWAGRIVSGSTRAGATVAIDREVAPVAEPAVRVTLAIGVLKGDQMDGVVRDATMLGVAEIAPMVTAHVTVPERAWRSGAAVERWQRVAIASAKQCGRAMVPEIRTVAAFRDVVRDRSAATTIMCVEPSLGAEALAVARLPAAPPSSALVLVGPEGGWASEEIDQARGTGAALVHLGPRTLRAETVPTVILAALWTVWGG